MSQAEEKKPDRRAWCGEPILNDRYWANTWRGTKIHNSCLEFLWRCGILLKDLNDAQRWFSAIFKMAAGDK